MGEESEPLVSQHHAKHAKKRVYTAKGEGNCIHGVINI